MGPLLAIDTFNDVGLSCGYHKVSRKICGLRPFGKTLITLWKNEHDRFAK